MKGSPFGGAPAKRVRGLFGGSKPPPYDEETHRQTPIYLFTRKVLVTSPLISTTKEKE